MSIDAGPPIIKAFRILGLHGYKDVELVWEAPARIVIAENGMGKTTILTALHAFLEGNLRKLRNLEFRSIEIQFAGDDDVVKLDKENFSEVLDGSTHHLLADLAQYASAEAPDILGIILEQPERISANFLDHPLLHEIYLNSPYSHEEIAEIVSAVRSSIEGSLPDSVEKWASAVADRTREFEILYLPTFRRVEIPLKSPRKHLARRRRSKLVRMKESGAFGGYPDANIQFGLADVSNRLATLFEEIERESNIGYRSISASIIDELLAGKIQESGGASSALPSMSTLDRFFSRIVSPDSLDKRLDSLRKMFESGAINDGQNKMLRYFLDKLSVVVDQTKELEANIEAFVERANAYLEQSSDEKVIKYDPAEMKVAVVNEWTGSEIDLDELSSGEKQVVSLLASLYLYPEKKIVLIDEPELSLSIDWQKRLLPDMLNSPSCAQLLAITHSPFIFDNHLDPYAGPLRIERRKMSYA